MGCLGIFLWAVVLVIAALVAQIPYAGPWIALAMIGGAIWFQISVSKVKQEDVDRYLEQKRSAQTSARTHAAPWGVSPSEPEHHPNPPVGTAVEPWSTKRSRGEVAGEAYRPEAFRKIFRGVRISTYEGAEMHLPAALADDSANPYDSNAVSVWVAGQHVGYLDRDTAAEYHETVAGMARLGQYIEVPARIWASSAGRRLNARVTLSLPDVDGISPSNALPDDPHVIIPPGSTIQVTKEEDHMDVLAKIVEHVPQVHVAATLRAIHEIRPRSAVETVEISIDGERVGILTPTQAANMLPLVKFFEERALVPVCRAVVKGSPLKADVTLDVVKSQDADRAWLGSFGNPVPAAPKVARAEYEWDED